MIHLRRWGALMILILLVAGSPASAHGGIVRLNDNSGPYHVIAATGPGNQREELRLTVVLSTQDTGDSADIQPIQGATVTATFQLPSGGAAPISYALPPEPTLAEFGYYERVLTLPAEGTWRVTIEIASAAGAAATNFPVAWQRPPPEVNWLAWVIALLPVVITIGFLLYTRRSRRPSPQAGTPTKEL